MTEFLGIMLEGNIPMPSIEDKIKPQDCAKDAAAQNTNLLLFAVAGVDGPNIIDATNDEIDEYDNNDNNDIIAVANVQQANAPHGSQPIVEVHNNNSIDNNVADNYTLTAMMMTMTMMMTTLQPSMSTPIHQPTQWRTRHHRQTRQQ